MANKKVAPLTDTEIKNAKPKDKDYTLADGNGLQLRVKLDGRKIWEIRYTINSKPKSTSAGTYPAVSLKEAREKRDSLKNKALQGIDPILEKKHQKLQAKEIEKAQEISKIKELNIFEKVSRDFIESIGGELKPRYYSLKLARLENHIFPYIGAMPIEDVTRMDIVKCLEILKLSGKGETAKRTLNIIGQVYKYAVTREIAPHNITADIDKRYIIGKVESKNFPTITDPKEIRKLLEAIEDYHGHFKIKYALKLGRNEKNGRLKMLV
jgi:hypothetical protein